MRLLLATNNPGKLKELISLLEALPIELTHPQDIGIQVDVAETGSTYEENAAIKATAFAQLSNLVTLADDSGLEVDALGGAPGLHSARFSPIPGATDADRRARLLQQLSGHPRPWKARFHCSVATVEPSGKIYFAQGDCPGEIIPVERGSHGFGYDPIFLLSGSGKTMAELSMQEKNALSHRARAVKAAIPMLLQIFNLPPTPAS